MSCGILNCSWLMSSRRVVESLIFMNLFSMLGILFQDCKLHYLNIIIYSVSGPFYLKCFLLYILVQLSFSWQVFIWDWVTFLNERLSFRSFHTFQTHCLFFNISLVKNWFAFSKQTLNWGPSYIRYMKYCIFFSSTWTLLT